MQGLLASVPPRPRRPRVCDAPRIQLSRPPLAAAEVPTHGGGWMAEAHARKLILYCTERIFSYCDFILLEKCLLLILWILLTVDYSYLGFYTTVILEICCFILTFLVKILLSHNG